MRKIILLFIFISCLTWLGCKQDPAFKIGDGHTHTHVDLNIPPGLPPMKIPADNPMTIEGVSLGRKLFYDNILSKNSLMNCGSCHHLETYFVDSNNAFSIGVDGIAGTRNSMPLFNIGYNPTFFWDGGSPSLEAQVLGPITNPVEMHESIENVINKLQQHPQYPTLFNQAFGTDKISSALVFKAIAQFERTMISGNSKFDRYLAGKEPLSLAELRGKDLYLSEKKGDCFHCHSYGSTFTDFEFRNTGLDSIPVDKGRALITRLVTDEGKFKTPSLRNIAFTAPYMHDGRFTTLRQCIEHYNRNFKYTNNLSPELKNIPKNRLNEDEINDLIAFLNTLTDEEFIKNQNLSAP
jgi:cytochrome c peroxidase